MAADRITVAEYAAHRGCSAPRIRKLIRDGRLDAVIIRERRGKKDRVFLTSAKAADQALEDSAAGPRGKRQPDRPRKSGENQAPAPAESSPRARPAPKPKGLTPTDKLDPRTMTKAEAVRMKAAEDAMAARVKRMSAELDMEIKLGEYIEVEQAEGQVDEFIASIVSHLDGIPGRFATAHPDASVAMADTVRKLIDGARRDAVGR